MVGPVRKYLGSGVRIRVGVLVLWCSSEGARVRALGFRVLGLGSVLTVGVLGCNGWGRVLELGVGC